MNLGIVGNFVFSAKLVSSFSFRAIINCLLFCEDFWFFFALCSLAAPELLNSKTANCMGLTTTRTAPSHGLSTFALFLSS